MNMEYTTYIMLQKVVTKQVKNSLKMHQVLQSDTIIPKATIQRQIANTTFILK